MTPAPRPSEADVVAAAARYLEGRGYRTWTDPDGGSYFDLVARRGNEVGLVEAKVANARAVLLQALVRRPWADWVAVVLPSERSARRLVTSTEDHRSAPVGVWCVGDGEVKVLREARTWVVEGAEDPYASLRARFRSILDALDRGEIPTGIEWDAVPGEVRRASGGRRFKEWRLDEPVPPSGRSP